MRNFQHKLCSWVLSLVVCAAMVTPAFRSEGRASLEPVLGLSLDDSGTRSDYVMTGKVRLLLFWIGSDDVGGGFIRRGTMASDPSSDFIQVMFGSDPAKAPRKINHWGMAIETAGESSELLGFMKSTKTASPEAAQVEMRRQVGAGEHAFQAIYSVVDPRKAKSLVVPILSRVDFSFHELNQAQQMAAEQLRNGGTVRELDAAERHCADSRGFLHAVDELARDAGTGESRGDSLCYIHNAREYTLTLTHHSLLKEKSIKFKRKDHKERQRTYQNLTLAKFQTLNHETGEKTEFELLLGSGVLAGVPVQISYQPNFWFKVILNLDPEEGTEAV